MAQDLRRSLSRHWSFWSTSWYLRLYMGRLARSAHASEATDGRNLLFRVLFYQDVQGRSSNNEAAFAKSCLPLSGAFQLSPFAKATPTQWRDQLCCSGVFHCPPIACGARFAAIDDITQPNCADDSHWAQPGRPCAFKRRVFWEFHVPNGQPE